MTYIELAGVLRLVPVSKPTLYRRIREDGFPKPVKVARRSFWIKEEVEAYMAQRSEAR